MVPHAHLHHQILCKTLWNALLSFVLILSSSGCQGGARTASRATAEAVRPVTTITFACRDYEREHFERLAAEFHEAQPTYQVQVLSADEFVGEQWDDALRILANRADTFTGWAPSAQDIARRVLRDLTPFTKVDPGSANISDDFYPGVLARFQSGTNTWGLPGYADPLFIFYNRTTLREAEITEPEIDWTVPEFEAAAAKLTTRAGATGRYGLALSSPDAAAALVLRHDTNWLTSGSAADATILAHPSILASANWLISLAREQGVMPDLSHLAGEQPITDLVIAGQAGMWVTSVSHQRTLMRLQGANAANIGATPLPAGPSIPQEVAAYGFMMSAGTQQPQAAWAWLNFVAQQPGPEVWGGLPARRSLAEASEVWQQTDATWRQSYLHAVTQPQPPLSADVVAELGGVLYVSLKEGSDPGSLLSAAKSAARPQPTTASAPPAVPSAAPATAVIQHMVRFCAIAYPPKLYEELGRKFSAAQRDTTIKVSGGDSFSFEQSSLKLNSCDCFTYFVHGQFSDSKLRAAVVNLQPLVEATNNFPKDYIPSVLEAHRWENALYAIPAYSSVRVLFYNKDLFDKAGLVYPKEGWTLDDFRQMALRLTSGDGAMKIYGYLPLDFGASDLAYFITQKEGFGLPNPAEYIQAPAALVPDKITDAMRWYTGLALTDKVMPEFQIIKGEYTNFQKLREQRLQLVGRGRVAMWSDALASSRTPAPALRIGVAPLPSDTDVMYLSHPVGYMISSASKERETCWDWITFLTQEPLAVRSAPVRKAFFADPAQLQPGFGNFRPVDSESDVARAELLAAYAISLPRAASQPGRENGYLLEAFDAIMEGASVEKAVGAALAKDEVFQKCLASATDQSLAERVAACQRKAEGD